MARTRGTARPVRPRTSSHEHHQMKEFEQQMRKYYPKNSKFFYNGSYYQPRCAENFKNPNSLVPQRYKRDFFRSFYADFMAGVPEPSKIPQNLQIFKILKGSAIVLRKLIKQNKALKHIVLESYDKRDDNDEFNTRVVKYLKYSKSLRSINFQKKVPLLSEMECRKMLNTWGKRIEKIEIGFGQKNPNVMEIFLQFPKLREFQLGSFLYDFPYDKLQERKIAYRISLGLENNSSLRSLMEEQAEFELTDYVNIQKKYRLDTSKKMSLERQIIERNSKQKHFLNRGNVHIKVLGSLEPIFQNILSLDLFVPEDEWANSSITQLDNLKHLSIHMYEDGSGTDIFGDFFKYLNKNVSPHKKLETFLIKADVGDEKKSNRDLALSFFGACSESLRKVHLEFTYNSEESVDAECFYEGLTKLKDLQSLSLFLDFGAFKCHKTIEKLSQIVSEIKSLEELDFNIKQEKYQGKTLNLKFPSQIKKLSFGMSTSTIHFDASKTLWLLPNLTYLELEFTSFSSQKWSKVLHDTSNRVKYLEVLVMKKTQKFKNRDEMLQMRERLDKLMKESSNLKLIIFANFESEEVAILRRSYSWSQINPIVDNLSFPPEMEFSHIKNYS